MQAVNRDSFAEEVVEASRGQPVLVDLWGPRCGPCLAMMPWLEAFAEQVADRVKIVKLNTWESMANRRLCVELQVLGLPTFLLYSGGAELQRITGDKCTPGTISQLVRDL
jgi:thioredoxin 1